MASNPYFWREAMVASVHVSLWSLAMQKVTPNSWNFVLTCVGMQGMLTSGVTADILHFPYRSMSAEVGLQLLSWRLL